MSGNRPTNSAPGAVECADQHPPDEGLAASVTGQNDTASAALPARPDRKTELAGIIFNHKGKLAVGVAAMLGLAIYYKWRENKLAKEDPEEHARLQRVKTAVIARLSQLGQDNDKERLTPNEIATKN